MITASLTTAITDKLDINAPKNSEAFDADQLIYDIQMAAIRTTSSAAADSAVNGGNLGNNLVSGLQSAAVGVLGKHAAMEIGQEYRQGNLDYVTHKIAHAALGGAMAAATGDDIVSGAIGGAVGEATAEAFVKSFINDKLVNPEKLKHLSEKEVEQLKRDMVKLKEVGVDLSRLSAGLAAALVGGEVDTAAKTGGNAARNNGVVIIPIALELIDKGLQAYDAYRLAKAIDEGNTEEAIAISAEIATGAATDAIPGNVLAVKAGFALKKFGLVWLGSKIIGKHGDEVVDIAKRSLNCSERQIKRKFKHAENFGIQGNNYNPSKGKEFQKAIESHVYSPDTIKIKGTYRWNNVIHYFNPKTNNNVITNSNGDFISGWRLDADQIKNVTTRGKL